MQRGTVLTGDTSKQVRDQKEFEATQGIFINDSNEYIPGEYEEPDYAGRTLKQIQMYRKNMAFLNAHRPEHLRPKRLIDITDFKVPDYNSKYNDKQNETYRNNRRRMHAMKIAADNERKIASRFGMTPAEMKRIEKERAIAEEQRRNAEMIAEHEKDLARRLGGEFVQSEKFNEIDRMKKEDKIEQSYEAYKMAREMIDKAPVPESISSQAKSYDSTPLSNTAKDEATKARSGSSGSSSRSPKRSTETEIIESPDGTVTEIGLSRVIATEDDDSDKTLVDETEIRKPPSPTPSVAQTLPPDSSSNYGTLRAADITTKESNNFDRLRSHREYNPDLDSRSVHDLSS